MEFEFKAPNRIRLRRIRREERKTKKDKAIKKDNSPRASPLGVQEVPVPYIEGQCDAKEDRHQSL
jgi:hypothetical protein